MELLDKALIEKMYNEAKSYIALAEKSSGLNKEIILRLCEMVTKLTVHAKSSLVLLDIHAVRNIPDPPVLD